jgi:hypothetical protein
MKYLLITLALSAFVLANDFLNLGTVTTTAALSDYRSWDQGPVEAVDLSKVDFSTNIIHGKRWSVLSTNQEVSKHASMMVHTVYPSCGCDSCNGRLYNETTTVRLNELIEFQGQQFQLSSKLLFYTNRLFNPLDSTNRIYRN